MNHLYLAPSFEVTAHRLHGCTPWLARLLWLLSYCRCVTVDRRLGRMTIATRRLWLWRTVRRIRLDQVSRIVYRAQALPSLNPLRYLSFNDSDASDSAFFLISLALKDSADELPLFTIWEQQPRDADWLDELAGLRAVPEVGDEAAGRVVELLHKYIGAPIT